MNKCSNFCTAMDGMELADWPDWHIPNKKGGREMGGNIVIGHEQNLPDLDQGLYTHQHV